MIILKSEKTKKLEKKLILSICKLKDTHWKNGLKSQKEYFKKIYKSEDLNNLLFFNKKLIGYTLLRKSKFSNKKSKKDYFHFDTLIIDKNYRKIGISKLLMDFNNHIIKKNKRPSFLFCKKKLINFYMKFNWKLEKKTKFQTKMSIKNKSIMSFNFNREQENVVNFEI